MGGQVKMKQNTNEHYNYLCIWHQFRFTFNTTTFMLVVSTLPACFTNWFLALWTVNNPFSLSKSCTSSSPKLEYWEKETAIGAHGSTSSYNLQYPLEQFNNVTHIGRWVHIVAWNTNEGSEAIVSLKRETQPSLFMRKATHVFSLLLSSKIAEDVVQSRVKVYTSPNSPCFQNNLEIEAQTIIRPENR